MRVLLVDDHPLFRDGMATLLGSHKIDVVGQAGEGAEALDKARELRPDLILMDINMPGLGGLEATRMLKAEMPEVKVVMLTVSEEEEDLYEAIKSGADGYLVKNLESVEFFALLDGLGRGESPLTPGLARKILGEFARLSRDNNPVRSLGGLTEREMEVLALVAVGHSNKEIGSALVISENTVKYHLSHILEKLHVQNRSQAVAWALQHGVQLPEESRSRS